MSNSHTGRVSEDTSSYSYLKKKSVITNSMILVDIYSDIDKMKIDDK